MNKTLIVNKKEATSLLKMQPCIVAMTQVLCDVSEGKIQMLQRSMLRHENGNTLAGLPASMNSKKIAGSKIIIFPGAETAKAGTSQGIVPIFSSESGELMAIIDGKSITTIRTAATSAAATDVLAKKSAHTLGILGAGKLGRAHVEAILLVRPIDTVYIWDMYPDATSSCMEYISTKFPQLKLIACDNAREASVNSEIICTATKASDPILEGAWLQKGAHINAVGACGPNGRELDSRCVQMARVFLDKTDAAMRDAGDLVIPINAGEITEQHILGEVGNVILGKLEGRKTDDDVTIFETVGLAVEDLAAAYLIYELARENGVGVEVEI